jgi:hypothetical protein
MPEDFWAEFSEAGKPLGYKSILARLTAERKKHDAWLYQKAKDEFGTSFNDTFSYTKNGQRHVKTKASDVAKQYMKLRGEMDSDCDEGNGEGDE